MVEKANLQTPKPRFENWQPNPESIANDKGELFARIFLPYSNLTWVNPNRSSAAMFEYYKKHGQFPEGAENEDWLALDDKGNYLPGNILEEHFWAVFRTLPINRLSRVFQLSLLTPSTEAPVDSHYAYPFHHDRQHHSLLTARVSGLIAKNNGFKEKEIIQAEITGFIHDIATPAGGDPTKELDPEYLDEETAIVRLIAKYDLSPLKKYGFDVDKAILAIQGKNLEGTLLDIADKVSYTALDIFNYVGSGFVSPQQETILSGLTDPIRAVIRASADWANIYRDVKITKNGEIYFENPQRLGSFLELRSWMHRALYLNPHCRGMDMFYKILISPLYIRNPKKGFPLNAENLLYLTDAELYKIINSSLGFENEEVFESMIVTKPAYCLLEEPEARDQTIAELEKGGNLVFGSETIRRFKPGIHFLTKDPKDSKIKPFSEASPNHAYYLEELTKFCIKSYVYYWPKEFFSENPQNIKVKKLAEIAIRKLKKKYGGKIPHYTFS